MKTNPVPANQQSTKIDLFWVAIITSFAIVALGISQASADSIKPQPVDILAKCVDGEVFYRINNSGESWNRPLSLTVTDRQSGQQLAEHTIQLEKDAYVAYRAPRTEKQQEVSVRVGSYTASAVFTCNPKRMDGGFAGRLDPAAAKVATLH